MPKAHRFRVNLPPVYQAPATLNQVAPVQNTWYTVLAATLNCRIYQISINIEDTNETVEVEITVDGQVMANIPKALTHSTNYYGFVMTNAINRTDQIFFNNSSNENRKAFFIEGRSIGIRIRKTTAAGVGNLTAAVAYGVFN